MDKLSEALQVRQVSSAGWCELKFRMVSTPQTRYTDTKHTNLPESALSLIKRIIQELFPDLMVSEGVDSSLLCSQ